MVLLNQTQIKQIDEEHQVFIEKLQLKNSKEILSKELLGKNEFLGTPPQFIFRRNYSTNKYKKIPQRNPLPEPPAKIQNNLNDLKCKQRIISVLLARNDWGNVQNLSKLYLTLRDNRKKSGIV